ncbi:LPS-assembly lipoprotein LptE [Candidatus Hartigia pinicola]|nr:LPS-assembly lipoprotein LptE [Candidatus Hartigia pinicola]
MRYLITLLLNLSMFMTTGCDFRLQEKTQIPNEFKILHLSSNAPLNDLIRVIRKQLRLNNITLVEHSKVGIPILKIIGLSEKTKTLSIYQDGKAAEKKLIFILHAQILMSKGAVYPLESQVERDFFDNPLEALAKDAENELIKQEMREQVARILVHKLLITYMAELEKENTEKLHRLLRNDDVSATQ